MITILYKETCDDNYEELEVTGFYGIKELINGYVVPTKLDGRYPYCVACNEEGRLLDLPHNTVIDTVCGSIHFVGPVVITKYGKDDFESLTEEDLKIVYELLGVEGM